MSEMGKLTEDKLKIIFKKSMNTLYTHSKTCSGISLLSTKSAILRIQKGLKKKHSYYVDKGKVKRDLSVETDICVLRRICKRKLNFNSNLGSSAKSKYSAVATEIETIDEFPDASACGDNEVIEIHSNYHTDLECLMVDNLKILLGQWIQKHLMHKKDKSDKLSMAFDSILHNLESKNEEIPSDTTYVIPKEAQNQRVKNKKIATGSISCQYCKRKLCRNLVTPTSSQKDSSSSPLPSPNKDTRIISTLSIPRTFNVRGLDGQRKYSSSYRLGKIKRKNIIISIDKFCKLMDSTSFDLLAVSTKSMTKKLANYDLNLKKNKHIVFSPKPFYKSATCSPSVLNSDEVKKNNFDIKTFQIDSLPSLLKSLYKNESAIVTTSVDKDVQFNTKNDNFTMTEDISKEITRNESAKEKIISEKQMKANTVQNSIYNNGNCLNHNKTTYTNTSHVKMLNKKNKKREKIKKQQRQVFRNKITPRSSKLRSLNSKHFTFMYEKASKQILQEQDPRIYWQNLFQYFNEHNDNKKIKVDIHVSMSPIGGLETKNAHTDKSNDTGTYVAKEDPTLLYNVKQETEAPCVQYMKQNSPVESKSKTSVPPTCAPEIIPILDGAISQAKYILDAHSKENVAANTNKVEDHCAITSKLEILQEIGELKTVIKDLAKTTEKLVSRQIRKDAMKSTPYSPIATSYNVTSSSKCEAVINLRNPSKTTQVCAELQKNCTKSHIDSHEDSKTKDILEYYNRLTKKSTSFRIIDSESLLRVTDMTSKANEISKFNRQFADEALMCSLPKSMSLFELPSERNKKLIAFFCDNCVKPKVNYNNSGRNVVIRTKSSKSNAKIKKYPFWGKSKNKEICCPRSISGNSCVVPISPGNNGVYSSTYGHSANSMIDDEESGKSCKSRGMGFSEGCMYCMLLWIPVLILGWFFYSLVLKNYLSSEKGLPGKKSLQPASNYNSSALYLKLSELGF